MLEFISKHITYWEATKSETAKKYGILNNPDANQLIAMRLIAENVFEPLRNYFKTPIEINSFFRSVELNKKVSKFASSQHTKGEAMDLDGKDKIPNNKIFDYIRFNLDFDQLIWEHGTKDNPDWVHVSYKKNGNRKQIIYNY